MFLSKSLKTLIATGACTHVPEYTTPKDPDAISFPSTISFGDNSFTCEGVGWRDEDLAEGL